jgi:predicted P-loop ATPase
LQWLFKKLESMVKTNLSKDIILDQYSEKDIFTRFANKHMNLQTPNDLPKKNVSSPFSIDNNPSFSFYTENQKTKFKCNSSGKQGDVWQFVADLNELDCKHDFAKVLDIIANEMNIALQTHHSHRFKSKSKPLSITENTAVAKELEGLQSSNAIIAKEEVNKQLYIESRPFRDLDLAYWKNLGVESPTLERFNVHSIKSHHFTGQKPKYLKTDAVGFAFELDGNYKLYIPEQKNIDVKKVILPAFKKGIFGLEQLGEGKKENIIICEGEKDAIVANSRNFNAVSFGSCTRTILQSEIDLLQNHCNTLFICYDNDEAGKKAIERIIKSFPQIIPLQLPKSNIANYDITDYFQQYNTEDFQNLIAITSKERIPEVKTESQLTTIIHITEDYLSQNYDIRHNITANEIEMSKKNQNEWLACNENSLWIEMQKKSIKVPASTLEKILKSDFVPKFNPLIDYFKNLNVWNGEIDYIKQYANYIALASEENREQFDYHFKKWCVRSVKCATDDNYFNKNAFVLSDDGKGQNIGKTTWIRNLCPAILSNYLVDNLPKDEKDAKIVLTQNFIINLDELAALSKQEINTLKSLFSADKIKVRFPYDKKDTVVRRVGNFIGSTNQTTFLHDETGSVRWLCFVADKIDFSYKENFNVDNLWAQAYTLANDGNFEEKLTADDIRVNEIRNSKFQVQTPEIDLIHKYLEIPKAIEEVELISATEIQSYLNGFATQVRLTPVGVGKALRSLGFTYSRNSAGGLWSIKKKEFNP